MRIPRLLKNRRQVIKSPRVFSATRNQIIIPFRPISLVLIIILLACCAYLLIRSDIFLVHLINISRLPDQNQVNLVTEQDLKNDTEDIRGRSMFTLNIPNIQTTLMKKHLSLKAVSLSKSYPDRLKIEYQERETVAIIEAKNGRFLLDPEGLIFAADPSNISAALFQNLDREVIIGEKINSNELYVALKLIKGFTDIGLLRAVFFDTKNYPTIYVKTQEGIDLYFTGESEDDIGVENQLATLQLIVKNATIEGKKLIKIDLRFKRPVVSY